jgi:Mrp family chromosome partitioning ATPase/capsular polysaccharide biosynthesis protein
MLDSTKSKRPVFVELEPRPVAPEPWRDGIGFRVFLTKVRQQRLMIVRLILLGSIMMCVAGLAYSLVRTPAFTASSELLILNTTLQLSGPEAVVTQILVENSLIQSAIEMLKSGKVLERVIGRLGLENIELILPKSRSISDLAPSHLFASQRELSETSRRQAALEALRSNIKVNRVGASQIISVRGRALTAADAARLTNEVAGSFVQEQNDTNAVITTSAALRVRIKVLGPTARIISEAVPPDTRDWPTASVALALSVIVGGALGMGVGLVITFFDRRVRSVDQLVAAISAECFGYLPRMKSWRGLETRAGGLFGAWTGWTGRKLSLSPLAQEYRHAESAAILRRAVLRGARSAVLERSGNVPHLVGVTSCGRAEGKTTFAANWAGLIAGDGSRVLLIDASCDDATLSNSLTSGNAKGLYQLLRGEAVPGEVIRAEVRPNIDLLPRGQLVGNIDIHWFNLVHAIKACGDCSYDWVIFDLPALMPVAEVRSAAQIVDELLVVVEWGHTSVAQLEQALHALGPVRDKILGTVINKTPWSSLDSESRVEHHADRSASAGDDGRKPNGGARP